MSPSDPPSDGENRQLRAELRRLGLAAAFFAVVIAVFVVVFALGLFH